MSQNYINHIALVLDASGSMASVAHQLVKVADAQISYLARRSKELDQETRITVYMFADRVQCMIYDKDVLRLPSIASLYRTAGRTALIDATLKSQQDLGLTPTIYGDHAFLTFVLTDGEENCSYARPQTLLSKLDELPDNWTVAVLVPDQRGKHEAKKFGFPADNIAIWDASTVKGVSEAGETIRQATDNFMQARASGVRGTRSLFSMDANTLNTAAVNAAGLQELPRKQFLMLDVPGVEQIKRFVESNGYIYQVGKAYYQLTKPEKIQPQKAIAVRRKSNGAVYMGPAARDILGLPDMEVKVQPSVNPEFDVFVQSTSVNRNLMPGTKLLLLS